MRGPVAARNPAVCALHGAVLARISPAHNENIDFFGSLGVGIETELAQLGPTGYRPLRLRSTLRPCEVLTFGLELRKAALIAGLPTG